ncbi:T9SS type A sorting domain-containing protein, partial [Flavobacterium sp. GT2P42]
TITATGGTGTMMFSSDNGATYVASGVFTGLTAGTYTWRVKDANGCEKTGTVTITIPTTITASAVANNPLCFGTANTGFTITATGGTGTLMYSSNNGSTYVASGVFTGLTAGTYTWSVKDANGCIKTGTVTITIPVDITASAVANNPLCFGAANTGFTITATGGTGALMYSSNNGATYVASGVFTGLTAGTYTWSVKDANGCIKTGTVTITIPVDITASAVANNPLCFGTANTGFTLTATGGTGTLMYSSNNGATYVASGVFTGLTAGTYTWSVKDANGCIKTGTVTITIPSAIVASATPANPRCCNEPDGSITLSISGGTSPYMVNFNGGGFVAQTSPKVYTGLTAGTYTWVVRDANNCIFTGGTVTLINPPLLVASAVLVNPICNGGTDGSITITASGGTGTLMYSINQGVTYQASNVFTGLAAGEYKWRVKDANDCLLKGTFILTTPPAVIVSATLVNPKCNGGNDGSFTLNSTGGNAPLMFSMNNGVSYQTSNVFNALVAGQYSYAVKEANGCVLRGMVNLINPLMIVASTTQVNPKCNFGADGSVTITATGGTGVLMYSKDDGLNYQTSNVFNGLAAGEFKWVVKDANNCILRGTVTLLNPALIAVSVATVSPSCCDALRDGSITLNATGGTGNLMYSIDNGISYQTSNIFGNLSAGEFKWVVKDVNNCQINGTVTIYNPSDPNARTVSTKTTTADFTAYPVPFKDVLTIRYDFDYTSDVNIEVFNVQGVMVLSKTETNAYLNKEITLHLHTYKGQEQVYIVKLTTDRGSSMKKVMSAK